MRGLFFADVGDKIFGVAPKEKGSVALLVSEFYITALIFLELVNHVLLAAHHRKIKDLRAANALTDLTFPGFYQHALFTEFNEFAGSCTLTVGDKIDECVKEHRKGDDSG